MFADIDWSSLFVLSRPWMETVIRGTTMYWFLLVVFRFIVRRDIGAVGIADILILVLVADASQNGMAGEYRSITDGIVLVSTLIAWNFLLDWLSYRFPAIRRFAEPPPLCLIRDGRMLKRNMRKEFITDEELWSKLREAGVDSIEQVKLAIMESDGQVSVVKKD